MLTSLVMILLLGAAQAAQNSRIIGGTDATPGEFPHQVSLRTSTSTFSHICGGSLIAENFVLTAAHCVSPGSQYWVGVGLHDRTVVDGEGEVIPVAELEQHPSYGDGTGFAANDLAVLRLSRPVTLGSRVGIIDLAERSFVGSACVISGWGIDEYQGDNSLPEILQKATVDVKPDSDCGLYGANFNDAIHVCLHRAGKSSCNGDSGGPLTCMQNGVPKLAGVTSWGVSGCPTYYPSVYVDLENQGFRNWIASTMQDMS